MVSVDSKVRDTTLRFHTYQATNKLGSVDGLSVGGKCVAKANTSGGGPMVEDDTRVRVRVGNGRTLSRDMLGD